MMTTPAPALEHVLAELYVDIAGRKTADPGSSYTASLFAKGLDGILKKVGEEAAETLIAAKNESDPELVYELADLWYHCLVLMAQRGIDPAQVAAELQRRRGRSGLDEKASRSGGKA